jgi:hypothetical protein
MGFRRAVAADTRACGGKWQSKMEKQWTTAVKMAVNIAMPAQKCRD